KQGNRRTRCGNPRESRVSAKCARFARPMQSNRSLENSRVVARASVGGNIERRFDCGEARSNGRRSCEQAARSIFGRRRVTQMKIDHIGIATNGIEDVANQKVRVAMLPIGESRIELLEPVSEDSPISKFLAKRGPGIHHIAMR